ncbi:MAG: c-type cytochrome [Magnetococcales bacterium]|nr:c-type cytochrome [Magnetococcales bacterium]MBF0346500.1 c-type cytochrome [Magnetococcales bacterium]
MKLARHLILSIMFSVAFWILAPAAWPGSLEEVESLAKRPFLDDYLSNVLFGYRLVTDTTKLAARYVGNRLRCSNCHLDAGTRAGALPLHVAGMYPKWRDKNGRSNGVGLRIRECFAYSMDGLMPPENAPEVLAISAYINFLSKGQVIGEAPPGRGVPIVPDTGFEPNPANGGEVYRERCSVCHGDHGDGSSNAPPLWGLNSYNKGAGMHRIPTSAGFIWANMPVGNEKSLSHQQALDVAAFLHVQLRPSDPRESRLGKLFEKLMRSFSPQQEQIPQ